MDAMHATGLRTEPRPAPAAYLGGNSRRGALLLDAGRLHVGGHASRERRWGSDGACLESVSDFSVDPIGFEAEDGNLYRYCANNPLLYTDPTGEDWLDCMSECIQDNDPLPYALGAAVKGVLALGGWQSKSALAAIARALGNEKLADSIMKAQKLFANQKPVTDLLSLISMGGKGANRAAWKTVQQVGGKVAAVLGPIEIGYGLALAAIETHCMGYCCTASWYGIPYNSADGNVIKAWEDYYF